MFEKSYLPESKKYRQLVNQALKNHYKLIRYMLTEFEYNSGGAVIDTYYAIYTPFYMTEKFSDQKSLRDFYIVSLTNYHSIATSIFKHLILPYYYASFTHNGEFILSPTYYLQRDKNAAESLLSLLNMLHLYSGAYTLVMASIDNIEESIAKGYIGSINEKIQQYIRNYAGSVVTLAESILGLGIVAHTINACIVLLQGSLSRRILRLFNIVDEDVEKCDSGTYQYYDKPEIKEVVDLLVSTHSQRAAKINKVYQAIAENYLNKDKLSEILPTTNLRFEFHEPYIHNSAYMVEQINKLADYVDTIVLSILQTDGEIEQESSQVFNTIRNELNVEDDE